YAVLVEEAILMLRARGSIQPGVIGQRLDAGFGQRGCGVLDLGARQAVDDAGVAAVTLGDEGLELRLRVLLVDDLISDIRAIEARHKTRRTGEAEAIDDLFSCRLVGRRRERYPRHVGKAFRYQG